MRAKVVVPVLVLVVMLPVALVGAAFGSLQVRGVQEWIARQIAARTDVRVDGLAIGWPLNVEADQVTAVDPQGPWLVLSQARLTWSPWALWRARLQIHHLTARRAELQRLPATPATTGPTEPPRLPWLPIAVHLDDLSVDDLVIDPATGLPAAEGRVSVQGQLTGGHLALALVLAGAGEGIAGQARVAAFGSGQVLQVVAQAAASGLPADLPIRSAHVAAVGRVDLASEEIALAHLRLDSDAGWASAGGWVRRWGKECDLHVQAWLPDLSVAYPGIGGSVRAVAEIAGPLAQPLVTFTADPAGLSTGVAELDSLLGRTPHIRGGLALKSGLRPGLFTALVSGSDVAAQAGGLLDPSPLVGAHLRVERTAEVSSGAFDGWAEADGLLAGAWVDPLLILRPEAKGRAQGRLVTAGGLAAVHRLTGQPAGQAHVDVAADGIEAALSSAFQWGPTARFDQIDVASAGDRARGNVDWDRSRGLFSGRLTGQIASVGRWAGLFGLAGVEGKARFDATLVPSVGQEVRVNAEASSLSLSGIAVRRVEAQATVTDLLGQPRGQVNLGVDGATAGRLQIDHLRGNAQGDLRRLAVAVDAAGSPGFRLHAEGQAEPEGGRYTIAALQLTLQQQTLRLLEPATVQIKPDFLRLGRTRLAVAGGQVDGEASLDRGRIDGVLSFTGLPLAAADPLLPELRPTGTLSGRVQFAGTREKPRVSGQVAGHQLDFAGHKAGIDADVRADWDGARLHAAVSVSGLHGSHLEGDGSCPLRWENGRISLPEGPLEARADGQGDLARLTEMVPLGSQTVSGRVTLTAAVTGSMARPLVDARVEVSNGRYQNFDMGTSLSAITLTATAQGGRTVRIEASGSDSAKGHFTATGQADLLAGPSFSADVSMNGLRIVNLDLATANANGNVRVDGAGQQGKASGHVTIDGADVDVGQALPSQIVTLDVENVNLPPGRKVAEPPAAEPPFDLALALDVSLRNLHLHGHGLDSQWGGHVDISGTASEPILIGQLKSDRGSFDLLGRRLTLNQGSVSFDGEQPPDPRLDITAQGQAQDMTAEVHVTGTARKPDLSFTSDPPLPRDEILSRLLFGASVGQLSVLQQLTLAKAAAGQITGGQTEQFDPLSKLRSVLGLDVLEAGGDTTNPFALPGMPGVPAAPGMGPNPALTGQQSGGRSIGPSLSAGKYLNNRTFLRVDQGTTGGQVTVEIELGAGFAAETQVGEGSGGGVGFRWKKDY